MLHDFGELSVLPPNLASVTHDGSDVARATFRRLHTEYLNKYLPPRLKRTGASGTQCADALPFLSLTFISELEKTAVNDCVCKRAKPNPHDCDDRCLNRFNHIQCNSQNCSWGSTRCAFEESGFAFQEFTISMCFADAEIVFSAKSQARLARQAFVSNFLMMGRGELAYGQRNPSL